MNIQCLMSIKKMIVHRNLMPSSVVWPDRSLTTTLFFAYACTYLMYISNPIGAEDQCDQNKIAKCHLYKNRLRIWEIWANCKLSYPIITKRLFKLYLSLMNQRFKITILLKSLFFVQKARSSLVHLFQRFLVRWRQSLHWWQWRIWVRIPSLQLRT